MWEVENSTIPVDPKERSEGWMLLLNAIKQDMQRGVAQDWGGFVGTVSGFTLVEGSELDIHTMMQQYVPFCTFKLYPLIGHDEVVEMVKSLAR
jgi:hypothetical protein